MSTKQKSLSLVILNTIALLIMLFMNFASNTNYFSSNTVADISHKYDTLFAPANYAFAIWLVIFLGAICFVINQWLLLKTNDVENFIGRTGIWFSVSNIANALWVYCWVNEKLFVCVILILILLLSLVVLTIKLRLELYDKNVRTIVVVWWPITYYVGWIMVATIACISSWLVSEKWSAFSISDDIWTIIMMIVATILYLLLIRKRNMRESAIIGAWAFIAIGVRQWNTHKDIVLTAFICAFFLLIIVLTHGYRNRYYAIPSKLKRGEW